jgi:hypothetical protein
VYLPNNVAVNDCAFEINETKRDNKIKFLFIINI